MFAALRAVAVIGAIAWFSPEASGPAARGPVADAGAVPITGPRAPILDPGTLEGAIRAGEVWRALPAPMKRALLESVATRTSSLHESAPAAADTLTGADRRPSWRGYAPERP